MDKRFARNEESVLKHVFGQKVLKWFHGQPDGYQLAYDDYLDFGSGATRRRLLDNITAQLTREYTAREYATIRRQQQLEEIDRAGAEQERRRRVAEKQIIGTKQKVGDRLQKNLEGHLLSALGESWQEAAAIVRVKAPTWYVNMSGAVKAPILSLNQNGNISATFGGETDAQGGEKKAGSAAGDNGYIPIDVGLSRPWQLSDR